ncbi:hypothetical protein EJB05_16006, partial [Eragrostis curvula]
MRLRPLLLVTTVLLLSSTAEAVACDSRENMTTRVNPLYYECCAQNRQYKVGDIYNDNLKSLVAELLANISTTPDAYFASGKVGSVSGFVLCRGDFTGGACAQNLNQTIQDAVVHGFICPLYKDVAIYYDQHMLSFSGDDFLYADRTNRPAWIASNMNYVNSTGGAAKRYGDRLLELMDAIADYCRVELVQPCLANLTQEIPGRFTNSGGDHRVGGRILGAWCNVRFEKDLFFQETKETLKLHMPKSAYKTLSNIFSPLTTHCKISCCKIDMRIQNELEEWTKILTAEIGSTFSLFTLTEIRNATDNFSEAKRLGEGAFGPVYRGQLRCGVAAIKRLSVHSRQGLTEFRNEIRLIANLRHLNLVKLIGCCIQHNENILVYEFMPNRSLDDVFSDIAKWASLTWSKRQNVINGIAQGLLYIHNYSQSEKCIVHRDLKASNILLDSEMNPKISDFGIARMFNSSVTELCTTRLVGTRGYMAPEYFFGNTFSVKSDVFSFGVLILEIISGRKVATSFCRYKRSNNLMAYAWRLWEDGNCKQLIDNSLSVGEHDHEVEIIRCSQIALLCVQANPEDRPDMKEVVRMLSNKDTQLKNPKQPSYFNEPIMNIVAATNNNNARTEYVTAAHVHPA